MDDQPQPLEQKDADRAFLCILRFEMVADAVVEVVGTPPVAGSATFGGCCHHCGLWQRRQPPETLLHNAARESADCDGRAEWLSVQFHNNDSAAGAEVAGNAILAAVLLEAGRAGLNDLVGAAQALGNICPFLSGDVQVLSCEPYGTEEVTQRIEKCRNVMLKTGIAELSVAGLNRLSVASAAMLCEHGYCVVDNFLHADESAAVPQAVHRSLEAWLGFDPDGGHSSCNGESCSSSSSSSSENCISGACSWHHWLCGAASGDLWWKQPEPRTVRSDYIASLSSSNSSTVRLTELRPVLAAMEELLMDLQCFTKLRGSKELQLAWYPAGTKGYNRHYDASPDDGSGHCRKVTAILYCNQSWRPKDGGELRVWPNGLGGPPVDVAPEAGRLLLFLSGAVIHQVLRTQRSRVALTMWAG